MVTENRLEPQGSRAIVAAAVIGHHGSLFFQLYYASYDLPMSQNNQPKKQQLRSQIRQQRQGLDERQIKENSNRIMACILSEKLLDNCRDVALYLSQDGEPSTTPIIEYCWANGIKTYLPVISETEKSGMIFVEYHRHSILQNNRYGIPEPQITSEAIAPATEFDAMLIPLVAFTEQGERLGMGGGYYDSFLAKLRSEQSSLKLLGLAHEFQKINTVPHDPWDMNLDAVITESKIYRFNLKTSVPGKMR